MKLRDAIEANSKWIVLLAIPALSFLLHLHVWNKPLSGVHAWRQCETASNVLNFVHKDGNIMNPHVYSLHWEDGLKRMEFPVMQWGMAQLYKVFGEHEIILRLSSWLVALFGIWGMYSVILSLMGDRFAATAGAWAWTFSPVLFYYSVNPLPDNLALSAGIWGIALYLNWKKSGKLLHLLLWTLCFSLSILAKLPFIIFLAFPGGDWIATLFRSRFKFSKSLLLTVFGGIGSIVFPLLWYAWVIPQWTGNGVVKGIFDAEAGDDGIMEILRHHLISTLPELLLNYAAVLFFIAGIVFMFKSKVRQRRRYVGAVMMAIAVGAYFMFEINMIGKAHDYYLFPFLPGLFLIVAYGIKELFRSSVRWLVILGVVALVVEPVTASLRTWNRWDSHHLHELISRRETLKKLTPDNARIIAGHDLSPHIFLYHLQKQGWNIEKNNIREEKVAEWMSKGAEYLYSNDRGIDEHPVIMKYRGEKLGEVGDFRVYQLKSGTK